MRATGEDFRPIIRALETIDINPEIIPSLFVPLGHILRRIKFVRINPNGGEFLASKNNISTYFFLKQKLTSINGRNWPSLGLLLLEFLYLYGIELDYTGKTIYVHHPN